MWLGGWLHLHTAVLKCKFQIMDYDVSWRSKCFGSGKTEWHGSTGVCYDNMKKRIAMEMGFEFRFIRLNEANVREHLLRN